MNVHRRAIEQLYTGRCDVYEYVDAKDDEGNVFSDMKEERTQEEIPCRLSHVSAAAVADAAAPAVAKQIKLFIAPEVEIRAGSKLVVTQDGVTEAYRRSGEPEHFATHQEITLELFRGYA